jgi:hypothetical protein
MHGLHSFVPNLPVSPLALPPPALRIEAVVTVADCELGATEKRPPISCLHDTEKYTDAGSTLSADPRGPKSGVHLKAWWMGSRCLVDGPTRHGGSDHGA